MSNSMDRKHAFEGLHNFRDFGGYAARGREIVRGRFFRSATHATATDKDLERLAALGIGVIFDLRRPDERQRQPSRRWPGFAGVVIENHDDDEGRGVDSWAGFMSTWDLTRESFRQHNMRYYTRAPHMPRFVDLGRRYFDALATLNGEGLVVHCAAGKDRTGLIVALTHALAGVHRDDIVADYLLSNDSDRFRAFGALWAKEMEVQRGRGPDLDTMAYVMSAQPEWLERSFDVIAERHGDVDAYLMDVMGVDNAKRAQIERRLFE
jgi:protein tyrosine/serine phosphatase